MPSAARWRRTVASVLLRLVGVLLDADVVLRVSFGRYAYSDITVWRADGGETSETNTTEGIDGQPGEAQPEQECAEAAGKGAGVP